MTETGIILGYDLHLQALLTSSECVYIYLNDLSTDIW